MKLKNTGRRYGVILKSAWKLKKLKWEEKEKRVLQLRQSEWMIHSKESMRKGMKR